eukprot:3879107-Pleurochrysis_carterae.AAC.2
MSAHVRPTFDRKHATRRRVFKPTQPPASPSSKSSARHMPSTRGRIGANPPPHRQQGPCSLQLAAFVCNSAALKRRSELPTQESAVKTTATRDARASGPALNVR